MTLTCTQTDRCTIGGHLKEGMIVDECLVLIDLCVCGWVVRRLWRH